MRLFGRSKVREEMAILLKRIENLEYRVTRSEQRAERVIKMLAFKDGPCDAKYGPYANSLSECDTCGWWINGHARAVTERFGGTRCRSW